MDRLILLIALLPAQAPASGQTPILGERYVDGTYRFSIQPPAGWRLIPRRERLRDETIILRMFQSLPDRRLQQIVISQSELAEAPAGRLLTSAAQNLELKYSMVEIIAQQEQQVAGRPAGYLSATFRRDNATHLHLQAIIHLGKSQCMFVTYEGPSELRAASEPLFQRCLASLKLLSDQMSEKELEKAFESARQWLSSLDEKKIRQRLIPDQLLRIEYQGRLVGFMRIQQFDNVLDRRPGVRVRERGWIFAPDGRVQRIQQSMFVSYDLKSEKWKSSFASIPPPVQGAPDVLEIRLEEGVRTNDVLLSNQTYDMLEPTVANPAITLPEMYLSRAVARLLPALIDLSAQQKMGFLEFDHNKAGLIIRVVEPRGVAELPAGASRADRPGSGGDRRVYRIDQREGLAADPSELYVDSVGRILLSRSGDFTLRPAGAEEIEREFSARVSAAELRISELEAAYREQEKRFGR